MLIVPVDVQIISAVFDFIPVSLCDCDHADHIGSCRTDPHSSHFFMSLL
jgi:hypothetical protein